MHGPNLIPELNLAKAMPEPYLIPELILGKTMSNPKTNMFWGRRWFLPV